MASYRKRGNSYVVMWREPEPLVTEKGTSTRWRQVCRSVPDEATAKRLVVDVEQAAALGQRWVDARFTAVATLRAAVLAYIKAAVDAGAPLATQRFRSSMLGTFLGYLNAREENDRGVRIPVTDLSLTLLERYAASLPAEGRAAVTRHRKVLEVERMWAWAFERPDRFPGVPQPRRYTGGGADADRLRPPPPVVASAAPTWAEVDAMIGKLEIEWHCRVALVMRYTGLRASQACGLRWEDIDVERRVLQIRAWIPGAKRSRPRVVPIAKPLVEEMETWGQRVGLVFRRRYRGQQEKGAYRGDALTTPFRRAWTHAEVPPDRWDGSGTGDRGRASPTHAIRRCVRTELLRAGVEEALVLYLVGQSQGITAAAYVPEGSPEQSPYWPRLVDAVSRIPDHRQERAGASSA